MINNDNPKYRVPSTEEFEILANFKRKPFYDFGISEIMKLSKKKSKPWVFNTLTRFEKDGLIVKKRKGNMNLYRASIKNPSLIGCFMFMECLKLQKMKHNIIIAKLIESIPLKNYCLIVFGSYANKTQKTDSDLDVCFLTDNEKSAKKLKSYINEVKSKSPVSIDENIITFNEFVEMLLETEENLGKQIYKNHIIAFNGNIFYELAKGANKRGFNE